ncbi:MAG TPA: hypothetical protein VH700_09355 [Gemmatimonadales bacterium]|jgi:hypothetical protein
MYLVEIETGREQLYQTPEALAAAICGGVIKPNSRIFHRTSSSWISITFHPEYRKAMAARAAEPLPPLPRKQWTFFGTEAPGRQIDETQGGAVSQPDTSEPAPKPRGLRGLFSRRRRAQPSDPAKQAGS